MLSRYILLFFFLSQGSFLFAQQGNEKTGVGMITGTLLDANNGAALTGATVSLFAGDALITTVVTDKEGTFFFEKLSFGLFSVRLKMSGYTSMKIDSINVRSERSDFNLGDIRLGRAATDMETVIVYAEKPLYENKDGKITFNASESALSNSATTTELLKQTPLVSVDADGKLLLRGKDVKVLIDDKPIDLDSRQLQDLLESMPGSMIEKIEVLTTPPPQYANEGGVINIVTKKGKVGVNGRLNLNYGTRGEAGINGSVAYRKKGLSLNISAGFSYNEYHGNSFSSRTNTYIDSTTHFNTLSENESSNKRPNGRLSVDYDLDKRNSLSFSFLYNPSDNSSGTNTEYSNINRYNELYKLSRRDIASEAENQSGGFNLSYTAKGKDPLAVLKINTGFNFNRSENARNFYQLFLDPASQAAIADSFQQQNTDAKNHTASIRINYDRPLKNKKFSLNLGANFNAYTTHNKLSTLFMKKPEYVFVENELFSNDLVFFQKIFGLRTALRYDFMQGFYLSAGLLQEFAETDFDIHNSIGDYKNHYFSSLPFSSLMKKWKSGYSLTLTYKRTIQRPGINQMNPSVDYSDPYNLRFGNPFLKPYYADNADIIVGYWNKMYNLNLSAGYNALQDIYSAIRLLQPDSKTNTTWQNISGRKEYESHFWGGLSVNKKLKTNLSFGYSYNVYSPYDRQVRKFRNGGSFNSSLNGNYQVNALMNATGNFTYNRFSSPQGTARTTLSMNIGIQQKFFKKNLSVSLNMVDPFNQQRNNYVLYGNGYMLESSSRTKSRNVRIAVGYNFKKKPPVSKQKKSVPPAR